jgi:hypothetical protein
MWGTFFRSTLAHSIELPAKTVLIPILLLDLINPPPCDVAMPAKGTSMAYKRPIKPTITADTREVTN